MQHEEYAHEVEFCGILEVRPMGQLLRASSLRVVFRKLQGRCYAVSGFPGFGFWFQAQFVN